MDKLLTENEAAQIAEVSQETIRKYRDCGLLETVVQNNQTFFRETDISTLFFAKMRLGAQRRESLAQNSSSSSQSTSAATSATNFSSENDSAANRWAKNSKENLDAGTAQSKEHIIAEKLSSLPTDASVTADSVNNSADDRANDSADDSADDSAKPDDGQPPIASAAARLSSLEHNAAVISSETSAKTVIIDHSGRETPKSAIRAVDAGSISAPSNLPSSLELIELNKSLREQIAMIREERNWLRERVEKLESRSEREQMLLLAESENVRGLIAVNKRSFWQKALPWLSTKD